MRARVLVVDDEQNVLREWARALRLAGYSVETALSGEEAIRKCEEIAFDVVIVDFIMPQMSGVEVLQRIRKKLPFVRSVIVSGKVDKTVDEREISTRIRQGVEADLYLHKPLSNERLREVVGSLLEEGAHGKEWAEVAKQAVRAEGEKIADAKRVAQGLKKLTSKDRRKKR